jgi:hypothetical protein
VRDKKPIDKAKIKRLIEQPSGLRLLHRNQLPSPPSRHEDLANHPLGSLFEQAEQDHLKSHIPMNSWTEVNRDQAKRKELLDCMWVYVYKFDKHARLVKCKARIVVRGDQQSRSKMESTYAATLAARSFRTFMAIAARFDLELKQYDAVNAFVHASLDEEIYMRKPPGYRNDSNILKLNKALYGLRRSPLLWQKAFTAILLRLGFKKSEHCRAMRLISRLKEHFNISGGEDLQWFLGIEIHRDRSQKLIWLNQSYIDKIVNSLMESIQPNDTPMHRIELLPYEGQATRQSINRYQRKVGSLLYAAVTTRIDIAFAVSRLARFLINPSPEHHAAADRVFGYLKRYRALGLQLGGGDDFTVASDASFADNTLDRKSSQAYVMTLFGGVIGEQISRIQSQHLLQKLNCLLCHKPQKRAYTLNDYLMN